MEVMDKKLFDAAQSEDIDVLSHLNSRHSNSNHNWSVSSGRVIVNASVNMLIHNNKLINAFRLNINYGLHVIFADTLCLGQEILFVRL